MSLMSESERFPRTESRQFREGIGKIVHCLQPFKGQGVGQYLVDSIFL